MSRERERERETETETERERQRQTDRQTYRQTESDLFRDTKCRRVLVVYIININMSILHQRRKCRCFRAKMTPLTLAIDLVDCEQYTIYKSVGLTLWASREV